MTNAVDMVNDLMGFQWSTKFACHYQAMLGDVFCALVTAAFYHTCVLLLLFRRQMINVNLNVSAVFAGYTTCPFNRTLTALRHTLAVVTHTCTGIFQGVVVLDTALVPTAAACDWYKTNAASRLLDEVDFVPMEDRSQSVLLWLASVVHLE